MTRSVSYRRPGRLPAGESLFTPEEARQIRDRYRAGESSIASLARVFRASQRTISLVVAGKAGYALEPDETPVVVRGAAEELGRIAQRNREAVLRVHGEGKTAKEASEVTGLALSTVWRIGSELGISWPRLPKPIAHGTYAGYARCGPPKCPACTAANNERCRAYSGKRRRSA